MNFIRRLSLALLLLLSITAIYFAQEDPIKVACIGNSITYGGMGAQSYPQRLGVLLGEEYHVENFGISGTTMLKNGDYPYWEEESFLDAQDFNADIIIILLGTNDSKPQNWEYGEEFYDNYMEFIEVLRAGEKDPVIFTGYPLPVFQTLAGINEPVVHDEIIPIIDSVITAANTLRIDFYNLMKDHADLVPDGVHPNATGYNMMAEFARDEILNMPSGQVITFRSDDMFAELNQTVQLRWKTSVNSSVTLNGESVNEIDSTNVNVTDETTYWLIAQGDYSDTSHLTIGYIPPGTIKRFYAEPSLLELGVGDTARLVWDASNGSVVYLNGEPVDTDGILEVIPETTTTYTLTAGGDISDTAYVRIELLDADELNRAYKRTVTASSSARGYDINSVVDGDPGTFWVSENSISAWINIDLGKDLYIKRVKIDWGDNYAKTYHLQLMAEDGSVASIHSNTTGDGGIDDITGLDGMGRYLRVLGISKNSNDSGYVVNEVEVYAESRITGTKNSINGLPEQYSLEQNYPNPFNPSTTIEYSIPVRDANFASLTMVKLVIYDILGREVAVLVNALQKPGVYSINLDARNYPSGVYFYELNAGDYNSVKKMMILK